MNSNNSITFCFLVTNDLSKEELWIQWFNELKKYNIFVNIFTHCSQPSNIKSEWLKKTLVSKEYIKPTQWGFIIDATFSLYKYSIEKSDSSWFSIHTETCVPIISSAKFAEYFHKYKNNSLLDYCKIWWDPTKINRGNLHFIPKEHHYAHQQCCILCKEDIKQILMLAEKEKELVKIIASAPCGDESIIAVFLSIVNNFENVISKRTTLVDWERTPNGNNPYTFKYWTDQDKEMVNKLKKNNELFMFLRKIDKEFPVDVLQEFILSNS